MPSFTFTTRGVDALKPTGKITDYWSTDPGEPGFGLRLRPSGVKTWLLLTRDRGHRVTMVVLGRYPELGLAKARSEAADKRAQLRQGESPADVKRAERAAAKHTVKAVFQAFCEDREAFRNSHPYKARTWPQVKRALDRDVVKPWGSRPISEIERPDVARLLTRKTLKGIYAANRLQAHLSRFFRFAVERGYLTGSPLAGLKRGEDRREARRETVLKEEEIKTLMAFLTGDTPLPLSRGTKASGVIVMPAETSATLKDLFQVLLLTAQRLGEVAKLKWEHVDLDGAAWTLPGELMKRGKPHTVPLSRQALRILEARRKSAPADATYVFGATATGKHHCYTWAARAAAAIRRATGTAGWRTHDLRRTASTGMGELGISGDVIDRVLAHAVPGVRGNYDHAQREAQKRKALERWAAHVEALVEGKAAKVVPIRGRRA